jgi:hypothetical protein
LRMVAITSCSSLHLPFQVYLMHTFVVTVSQTS